MSRGKQITPEQRAHIVEMRNDGKTHKSIAAQFQISCQAVSRILREEQARYETENAPKDPAAPPRNCIDGFTPMYQRIIELNRKKQEIDRELHNIRATLRNALEIAENGKVP